MKTHIGQLNEQPLHHALKAFYARPDGQMEVSVAGYVVDVVKGDLLIEIQVGNFSAIKRKLTNLLEDHQVRLVYPIAVEKWLLKLPEGAESDPQRRKSPRRGRQEEVFAELVSFPELLNHPDFSLELVLVREEEVRRRVDPRRRSRNGWETVERRLMEVLEQAVYENPAQMGIFLPSDLPDAFTSADLAAQAGISRRLAQKMAYCLRTMGVIKVTGKQGRFIMYSR